MKEYKYYDILRKPVITEKSTAASEFNKYIFKVAKYSNKDILKEAIEKVFSVKVKKINIINIKGKVKKFKSRIGVRPDIKKAIVTLEKGFNIDYGGGIK